MCRIRIPTIITHRSTSLTTSIEKLRFEIDLSYASLSLHHQQWGKRKYKLMYCTLSFINRGKIKTKAWCTYAMELVPSKILLILAGTWFFCLHMGNWSYPHSTSWNSNNVTLYFGFIKLDPYVVGWHESTCRCHIPSTTWITRRLESPLKAPLSISCELKLCTRNKFTKLDSSFKKEVL